MKISLVALIIFLIISGCSTSGKNTHPDYNKHVNVFIGTGAHGHTYPGPSMPFGMVKLGPDTRLEGWDGCAGYHYSDSIIYGFSHTHLSGTGVSDYGDILFMPTVGNINFNNGYKNNDPSYKSAFSHKNENAEPGYYSVLLDKYKVKAELTVTNRVGFHRYTFPNTKEANIIIDLKHRDQVVNAGITIVNDSVIEGFRKSTNWALDKQWFFVAKFSKPFISYGIAIDDQLRGNIKNAEGKNIKACVRFTTGNNEQVLVKVGISAVSIEGARNNLEQEQPGWDFTKTRLAAKEAWNNELSKIEVEGGTADQQTIFYTALYHSMLSPDLFMDADEQYRGMDKKIHKAGNFSNYTLFSLWDTYRALHPLLTMIDRKRSGDFVNTLIEKYKQNGELPMWELAANDTRCMIGYHAVSVIADAYAKGIRNFSPDDAWKAMVNSSDVDKRGLMYYKEMGYVPTNKSSQSVSKTLEYAYDDYCIALMAKALKKNDEYERFIRRSQFYKNVFDTTVDFMRGRNTEREWRVPFIPMAVNYDYTEGNSYQYLYVPHDVPGLIHLFGSKERFITWLDSAFATKMKAELSDDSDVSGMIGQYAHGNEPSHHLAYLYNFAGAPYKTQKMVRRITNEMYQNSPEGLCGNEDCGQMSAWYVLSAIGLYPVCPGIPEYAITSPLFDKVTIHLENGKDFVIKTNRESPADNYIQTAELNGKTYNKPFLNHSDIINGSVLSFTTTRKPDKRWGASEKEYAKAMGDTFVSVPYYKGKFREFLDADTVTLDCPTPGSSIYYTLNGETPTKQSNRYTGPFVIKQSDAIKIRAFKDNLSPSYIATVNFTKVTPTRIDPNTLRPGLKYSYYEGIYRSIWDFEKESPVKTGIVPSFDTSGLLRSEWIAFDFDGYIKIVKDGIYTFYMNANDGGQLSVNGKELVESDGRKSFAFEQRSALALKAGSYPIRVKYFQCSDLKTMEISWSGPGFRKTIIPKNVLFH
jgi:predicted alpha-1,2-mannosidase